MELDEISGCDSSGVRKVRPATASDSKWPDKRKPRTPNNNNSNTSTHPHTSHNGALVKVDDKLFGSVVLRGKQILVSAAFAHMKRKKGVYRDNVRAWMQEQPQREVQKEGGGKQMPERQQRKLHRGAQVSIPAAS